MAYALKLDDQVIPMTHLINPDDLLNNSKNTIVFEHDEQLKQHMLNLFSTGDQTAPLADSTSVLQKYLPHSLPKHLY